MIASTILYPFNLIRSRQQQLNKSFFEKINNESFDGDNKKDIYKKNNNHIKNSDFYKFKTIHTNINYGNFLNTTKTIYIISGFKGFYKGLIPLLIRQIPGSSAFFYTYEYTLSYLKLKFL